MEEEEYNWSIILKISVPFSLIEAFIFYTNISNVWKWLSLVISMLASGAIVYQKDKKKHNIFTSIGIIFLAALIVRFLKNFGFF